MSSRLGPLFLTTLTVIACSGGESRDVEREPTDDTEATQQGLVTCGTRQDTGYRRGNPFPVTLVTADGQPVERATANAYAVMQAAAASQGVQIRVVDGFRTPSQQAYFYSCYVNCSCNQCNEAASPGWSNHQSGLALDLNTSSGNVYNWLAANGGAYGFVRTVPSERWHWEYNGRGPGGGPCNPCQCSPGQVQTEACGDCGTRRRSCNASCAWDGFSACAGPDPAGGTEVCSTGGVGVCQPARRRCVGGTLTCRQLEQASPETCDGLDNDCDGEVDDGHPTVVAPSMAFAATLVDASYPRSLRAGERATAWVDLRNDGTTRWAPGDVFLKALGGADGQSAFTVADRWLAFDLAAGLTEPVAPHEVGRFLVELSAPRTPGVELTERFQLVRSSGALITCPSPELNLTLTVLEREAPPDAGAPTDTVVSLQSRGCTGAVGSTVLLLPLVITPGRRLRRARASRNC
jgi:hypothetical protein